MYLGCVCELHGLLNRPEVLDRGNRYVAHSRSETPKLVDRRADGFGDTCVDVSLHQRTHDADAQARDPVTELGGVVGNWNVGG